MDWRRWNVEQGKWKNLKRYRPRLFPLFEPEKGVLKKAKPKNAFGKPKTQLFIKVAFWALRKNEGETRKGLWTPEGP